MPIVSLSSGVQFEADTGTSILDAASKAGVRFPYSCRTGRCGVCRCRVTSGESIALEAEPGLSPEEREHGFILSCVRGALTDLELEVEDLGDIEMPQVKTLPCRISTIDHLAPDVIRVMARLPPAADLKYIPGQYVEVIGANGIRRSYSLAGAPAQHRELELHIRAVKDGAMSAYWFGQAKPNDLLRLYGPLGTFFLRDVAGLDLILLATGTGIAPVKAMLEDLTSLPAERAPRSVSVFWGGRHREDLYFDVGALPGSHSYVPVLSRAPADWPGARGHVQDVLLDQARDLSSAAVYACGSDAMVRSARQRLIEAGLQEKRFYSDAFVCSG